MTHTPHDNPTPEPHTPPDASRPAPPAPAESGQLILGQFLKFAGMLVTAGGALAMFRTEEVGEWWFGGRPWFFMVLLPLGMLIWVAGFFLVARSSRDGEGRRG